MLHPYVTKIEKDTLLTLSVLVHCDVVLVTSSNGKITRKQLKWFSTHSPKSEMYKDTRFEGIHILFGAETTIPCHCRKKNALHLQIWNIKNFI